MQVWCLCDAQVWPSEDAWGYVPGLGQPGFSVATSNTWDQVPCSRKHKTDPVSFESTYIVSELELYSKPFSLSVLTY